MLEPDWLERSEKKSKSEVKRKGITNSICRAALPNKEDANEKTKTQKIKNLLPHTASLVREIRGQLITNLHFRRSMVCLIHY